MTSTAGMLILKLGDLTMIITKLVTIMSQVTLHLKLTSLNSLERQLKIKMQVGLPYIII